MTTRQHIVCWRVIFQKRNSATPLQVLREPLRQELQQEPRSRVPPLRECLRQVLREHRCPFLLCLGPWYCLVRLIMAAPRTGQTADTPWHNRRTGSETVRDVRKYTTLESLVQMHGPGWEGKVYVFLLKTLHYLQIDILLNIHVHAVV